jgi:hypothetical protein
VYFNSYGSRPGEWAALKRKTIEKQVDKISPSNSVLIMEKHKTAYKYGALGRFVPEGNLEGMRKILEMPSRGTQLFFEPPKDNKKLDQKVIPADLLQKFCAVHMKDCDAMTPTLHRKMFHTTLNSSESRDKAHALLCRVDGHSFGLSKDVYITSDPKQDAKVAEELFKAVQCDFVPWPSSEECIAAESKCIQDLDEHFYRLSQDDKRNIGLVVRITGVNKNRTNDPKSTILSQSP